MRSLPVVPSRDAQVLSEQVAQWIDHLEARPEAATDAGVYLDACLRTAMEEVLSGDLDAPARWLARLAAHDPRLDRDLPEPPDGYRALLQQLHHLQRALEQVRRVVEPRRVERTVAAPSRALDRAVLRAVDAGRGTYLRRKEVVARLVLPADERRTDNRVGQVLDELFEQGLLLRLRLPGQGGTHPHYALSPRGAEVLARLPAEPSTPAAPRPAEERRAAPRPAAWATDYAAPLHYRASA